MTIQQYEEVRSKLIAIQQHAFDMNNKDLFDAVTIVINYIERSKLSSD